MLEFDGTSSSSSNQIANSRTTKTLHTIQLMKHLIQLCGYGQLAVILTLFHVFSRMDNLKIIQIVSFKSLEKTNHVQKTSKSLVHLCLNRNLNTKA